MSLTPTEIGHLNLIDHGYWFILADEDRARLAERGFVGCAGNRALTHAGARVLDERYGRAGRGYCRPKAP